MLSSKRLYTVLLILFSFLMLEYLNYVTLVFLYTGLVAYYFNYRPSKYLRSTLAIGLFVAYWLVYGKMIEPEIGLNFLTSIIVLKILEKESLRDDYMIFYGVLLLIASGTLFEKNIRYSSYAVISLMTLILHFLRFTGQKKIIRSMSISLLWTLPISFFLFMFTPRIPNPLNMNDPGPSKGEIGYTPSVMVSEIESLQGNDSKVFHAKVENPLPIDSLYWRGNVLEFSDGWNWPQMEGSLSFGELDRPIHSLKEFKQEIKTLSKQDYFFGLDWPGSILESSTGTTGQIKQDKWRPRNHYTSVSYLNSSLKMKYEKKPNRSTSLSKAELKWIHDNFSKNNPIDLIKEIQDYFDKNKFSYTLSPGKVSTFNSFMQEKRRGFCSHYASAVALIMRAKDIDVRLVSGFLGGDFNKYANFYTITHNDAHVWIEYFTNDSWVRLDPTMWIAPSRIQQSSLTFIEENSGESSQNPALRFLRLNLSWFNDLSQWIAQLDYLYNMWIEEVDFYEQEQLFLKFKLSRKQILPISLGLFLVLGVMYFFYIKRKNRPNQIEELWILLKNKFELPLQSTAQDRQFLEKISPQSLAIFDELVRYTFEMNLEEAKYQELKGRIKKLNQ